ncbi:hypothetical protein [Flagellimonas sp.]|uniref:hypothetical protein n=1 Tax=Flagellimonas sp. TaxID=2058762 RepID=UPI003BAD701F
MKNLLVALFLFSATLGTAQMVVNDPTANKALIKQLTQGAKTVEQATKTVKLLKQTKEMYDNINSALQTLNYISDMSVTTKKILENSGTFLRELQSTNMFTNSEMSAISTQFTRSMDHGNTILKVANDLMRGGIFKMNDAERITLLKQSNQDLNDALTDTYITRKKYLRIAERRALNQYFSNQQTN